MASRTTTQWLQDKPSRLRPPWTKQRSACAFPASNADRSSRPAPMKPAASPQMLPFREVRHFQADDCLHYETIAVRGQLHDWTIPAHRHPRLHQIHLLASAAVVTSIDGLQQSLAAPAVWMLAPGTLHGFAYARNSAGQQIRLPSPALERHLRRHRPWPHGWASRWSWAAPRLATSPANANGSWP